MDNVRYALTDALVKKYVKKCGDCCYWMTKNCPRERNQLVSMNSNQCDKFKTQNPQEGNDE